jgi:hypothetical protein
MDVPAAGCEDQNIHNYLLSLFAKQTDKRPLLDFIRGERPKFDPKYALRMCHQQGQKHACVLIYSMLGSYEVAAAAAAAAEARSNPPSAQEAVQLALSFDGELAKKVPIARPAEQQAAEGVAAASAGGHGHQGRQRGDQEAPLAHDRAVRPRL